MPREQVPTPGRVRDVVPKPLVDLGARQRGPVISGGRPLFEKLSDKGGWEGGEAGAVSVAAQERTG